MNRMKSLLSLFILVFVTTVANGNDIPKLKYLDKDINEIVFIERLQYMPDHHNTATMFQKGEINENSFIGGSALKSLDLKTKMVRVILESKDGIIRDPEVSFDGKTIIFSMRNNKNDHYHIYEINADGSNLKQLTFAGGVSDIDPLYLPDGTIIFSGSREPKYCMCNRHIMCNMYRMEADGANVTQIGKSTLFEGHSALMNDGRIIYDRWEYVDRNFGDAQALWTVNPDGTKHAIYYGNNTSTPGAIIDARAIPGSELMACIFSSCHDRPWGALAVIDRRKGVDGIEPLVSIWPRETRKLVGIPDPAGAIGPNMDIFKGSKVFYEDPFPLNENQILVSRTIGYDTTMKDLRTALYLVESDKETLIYKGEKSIFDPQPLTIRYKPNAIPDNRDYKNDKGTFYVQNVYEGTHMKGIEKGVVKYLRVIESPPKRSWTKGSWGGQGEQAPGMNWTNFENKVILGEVPVEEDGSVHFQVAAGKFVYFQLLDKDKKMVQSMRSGTMAHSGEVNGCIGCHENRINVPPPTGNLPTAMKKKPAQMNGWMDRPAEEFSYMKIVQPILDKHCVSCHDFDKEDRNKTILAADRDGIYNASYIDLMAKKKVKVVGAGPSAIQEPYTWGAHSSQLTKMVDSNHRDVKLSEAEKQVLYTWMDLNAVFYPTYESAYYYNLGGRCPLSNEEINKLCELTGVNLWAINGHWRQIGAQIAFERPSESPCLDAIRGDKEKYDQSLALITEGKNRLEKTPNGDVLEGFVPCEIHKVQLRNYAEKLKMENDFMKARTNGKKVYDKGHSSNPK